jgi:terminase small subunit / prophage DNA-packing protein
MKIISELPLGGDPIHRIGGRDLCDLLGLSPAALTDLKARGIAVHLGHDAYDLQATVRAYVQNLRSVAAGWGTEENASTLTNERARLAKEQADAQALKNGALRGELVKAADVAREWGDMLRQVRARILAAPSRLRAALPHLTAADVIAIDREIRDALQEAANADD